MPHSSVIMYLPLSGVRSHLAFFLSRLASVSEGSKWVENKSTGAGAERWAGGGRRKAKGPALDTDMSLSDSLPQRSSRWRDSSTQEQQ